VQRVESIPRGAQTVGCARRCLSVDPMTICPVGKKKTSPPRCAECGFDAIGGTLVRRFMNTKRKTQRLPRAEWRGRPFRPSNVHDVKRYTDIVAMTFEDGWPDLPQRQQVEYDEPYASAEVGSASPLAECPQANREVVSASAVHGANGCRSARPLTWRDVYPGAAGFAAREYRSP